jgi:hypothetical protein
VHMRMVMEVLAPCVQDGDDADRVCAQSRQRST